MPPFSYVSESDRCLLTLRSQKAENEARIKMKKLHSSKKSSRRGSKYDE